MAQAYQKSHLFEPYSTNTEHRPQWSAAIRRIVERIGRTLGTTCARTPLEHTAWSCCARSASPHL